MIKKLMMWVLVFACAVTIFLFSAQKAEDSGRASEGFAYKIIEFFDFKDTISDRRAMEIAIAINGIVRKLAHFAIYALLGFLIAMLVNEYNKKYQNIFLYSVISSFLYSCSDEFHQYFVPGRSAQVSDVILDTFGALCGALFALAIIVFVKKRNKKHTG